MEKSRICMNCCNLIPENSDICPRCGSVYISENELPKEKK